MMQVASMPLSLVSTEVLQISCRTCLVELPSFQKALIVILLGREEGACHEKSGAKIGTGGSKLAPKIGPPLPKTVRMRVQCSQVL